MDEETLKKIFNPFFSTKEKGTGLGLSICYGIIENHKGTIEAHSKPGKGTSFLIKLPITRVESVE
jgi:signal transduction histidine kinase